MTTRTVITCDGTWPPPHPGPCTAKLPLPGRYAHERVMSGAGWAWTDHNRAGHLCPAHKRQESSW